MYKVVQQVRDKAEVIEASIDSEWLSIKYRKTLCGCDPLARIYDDQDECVVDYLFYEHKGYGQTVECPDPRDYVDSSDYPFLGELEHICPPHVKCMDERSGQIDEHEEDYVLVS
jgi:hypothetical protein